MFAALRTKRGHDHPRIPPSGERDRGRLPYKITRNDSPECFRKFVIEGLRVIARFVVLPIGGPKVGLLFDWAVGTKLPYRRGRHQRHSLVERLLLEGATICEELAQTLPIKLPRAWSYVQQRLCLRRKVEQSLVRIFEIVRFLKSESVVKQLYALAGRIDDQSAECSVELRKESFLQLLVKLWEVTRIEPSKRVQLLY